MFSFMRPLTYREQVAPAPDTPVRVGVAIACLNESYELEATVASFASCDPPPAVIAVYDDASRVPVAQRLAGFPMPDGCELRVVRGDGPPIGSGAAKGKAAAACDTDVVVIADAHVRVNRVFMRQVAQLHRDWPMSVLCPRVQPGNYGSAGDFRGCYLDTASSGYIRARWRGDHPPIGQRVNSTFAIPAFAGGCYIFPKTLLDAIGGYCPWYAGWGVEEETMSVLAWRLGYDVRLCEDLCARHTFWNERLNAPLDRVGEGGVAPGGPSFNAYVGANLIYPEPVLRHIEPNMVAAWPVNEREAIKALWRDRRDAVLDARTAINAKAVRSFREVVELIGLPVPVSPQHHETWRQNAVREK